MNINYNNMFYLTYSIGNLSRFLCMTVNEVCCTDLSI